MSQALVIASIERAGDHAAIVGVLIVLAAAGGLVYGLVRFAARSRAARTRSAPGSEADRRRDG
jgi:hypothetical protein